MKTVFLDANIFFAATLSETGGSRALFLLTSKRKLNLVSSRYAVEEAKRNIERKLGKNHLPVFWKLCAELQKLHTEENEEESAWEGLIIEKNRPILEAAKALKVDALVTLDRKDFMNEKMKRHRFPFKILTPGELIQSL